MMGKTHLAIGLSYGLTVVSANHFTPVMSGFLLAGFAIGSFLPDIDHPNSVISHRLPLVASVTSKLTRHRGILHSFVGLLLVTLLMGILSALVIGLATIAKIDLKILMNYFASGLIMAYMLHLIADALTTSGVPLFYPFHVLIRFPLVKTGGTREFILRWVLIFISISTLVSMFVK